MGCNFCTTSAFFGGKGKSVTFYRGGQDVFRVMCEAEAALDVEGQLGGARRLEQRDLLLLLDALAALGHGRRRFEERLRRLGRAARLQQAVA